MGAVSEDELTHRLFAMRTAEARKSSAAADVATAEAAVAQSIDDIDRLKIRVPTTLPYNATHAKVLQVSIPRASMRWPALFKPPSSSWAAPPTT